MQKQSMLVFVAKQRSNWQVSVHELMHRPGEQRELQLTVQLKEKMGEAVLSVAIGQNADIDLRLESVHEGILATGEVATLATGECVRCLKDIELPVKVDFQELFPYHLEEGFDYQVQDDHVDLEPIIRDVVVLALPFNPVCPDGCEKPELAQGINLVFAEDETAQAIDPRWAKLAEVAENTNKTQNKI